MEIINDYEHRLNQVVDFIQKHLDIDLDLSRMAEIAGFSPFHFHRMFSAVYQETPHEMLNRLRLEKAANLLIKNPRFSLTEIAFNCGFSSSSVFSRSFKQTYRVSPSTYRKANALNPDKDTAIPSPLRKKWIRYEQWKPILKELYITSLPDYHVVCAVSRGYNADEINKSWQRLMSWYQVQPYQGFQPKFIGVSFDDPLITPPDKCRYYASITTPQMPESLPRDLFKAVVPGGSYAVCPVICKPQEIHEVYMTLYRHWLPQSGYQCDDKPPYDVYYQLNHKFGDAVKMDICLPITRL